MCFQPLSFLGNRERLTTPGTWRLRQEVDTVLADLWESLERGPQVELELMDRWSWWFWRVPKSRTPGDLQLFGSLSFKGVMSLMFDTLFGYIAIIFAKETPNQMLKMILLRKVPSQVPPSISSRSQLEHLEPRKPPTKEAQDPQVTEELDRQGCRVGRSRGTLVTYYQVLPAAVQSWIWWYCYKKMKQ